MRTFFITSKSFALAVRSRQLVVVVERPQNKKVDGEELERRAILSLKEAALAYSPAEYLVRVILYRWSLEGIHTRYFLGTMGRIMHK